MTESPGAAPDERNVNFIQASQIYGSVIQAHIIYDDVIIQIPSSTSGREIVHRDERAAILMARLVSEWEQRVELSRWDNWTSSLLQPTPTIDREQFKRFSETSVWLATRRWPSSGFSKTKRAFDVFTQVWGDLMSLIDSEFHTHPIVPNRFCLREKHKEIDYDPALYKQYGDEFDMNCELIHHLVIHATAAANLLCDAISVELDSSYRFEEGYLKVTRGLDMNLKFTHICPKYIERQEGESLYPGLEELREFVKENAS